MGSFADLLAWVLAGAWLLVMRRDVFRLRASIGWHLAKVGHPSARPTQPVPPRSRCVRVHCYDCGADVWIRWPGGLASRCERCEAMVSGVQAVSYF